MAKKEKLLSIDEIFKSETITKFLLDTNVLFAYINPNNEFHLEAKAALDGLAIKHTVFFIPHIVLGEFIAHKLRIKGKNITVKEALGMYLKMSKSLKARILDGGPTIDGKRIVSSYLKHSSHRNFIKCGFADFMILTFAEEIPNIRIVTCDKEMAKFGRTIFKDKLYYLPNKSRDLKSDFPRLMTELQGNFATKKP